MRVTSYNIFLTSTHIPTFKNLEVYSTKTCQHVFTISSPCSFKKNKIKFQARLGSHVPSRVLSLLMGIRPPPQTTWGQSYCSDYSSYVKNIIYIYVEFIFICSFGILFYLGLHELTFLRKGDLSTFLYVFMYPHTFFVRPYKPQCKTNIPPANLTLLLNLFFERHTTCGPKFYMSYNHLSILWEEAFNLICRQVL